MSDIITPADVHYAATTPLASVPLGLLSPLANAYLAIRPHLDGGAMFGEVLVENYRHGEQWALTVSPGGGQVTRHVEEPPDRFTNAPHSILETPPEIRYVFEYPEAPVRIHSIRRMR